VRSYAVVSVPVVIQTSTEAGVKEALQRLRCDGPPSCWVVSLGGDSLGLLRQDGPYEVRVIESPP
jgi:hypothetical protein